MANDVIRPIDAGPLIADGWVLEKHGVSNCIIGRKSLADVPTIDPESLRPKGRWELVTVKYFAAQYGRVGYCQNCNEERLVDNYCPNCGAKMEG